MVFRVRLENMMKSASKCRDEERALFCHQLVKRFKQASGKIRCRRCLIDLNTRPSGRGMDTNIAFKHALTHLKAPVYCCRLCQTTFYGLSSLADHLKKEARVGTSRKLPRSIGRIQIGNSRYDIWMFWLEQGETVNFTSSVFGIAVPFYHYAFEIFLALFRLFMAP